MVTGRELLVGWFATHAWVKAWRAAGQADAEVDRALDVGGRLHDLVSARLGAGPAGGQARQDVVVASVGDQTALRVQLAMEDATATDAEFAARLAELVAGLRQTKAPTSMTSTPEGLPRACASERIEPLTDGRLEFTGQPRYAFTFGAGRARSPEWWS